MKNLRYCPNSLFIYSVCSSVCEWKDINSLVSIPSLLFSFFVNFTANCGSLSNTTLSGSLYNFHMLFLNHLASSSANVLSIIATKCIILDNLLHTTKIVFFSLINSNFVIKSTIKYIHGISDISLNFNFLADASILF